MWYLGRRPELATLPVAQPAPSDVVVVRWLPPEILPGETAYAKPVLVPLPVEETDTPSSPSEFPPSWTQPDVPASPRPGVLASSPTHSHDAVDSPALPVTAPDFGAVLLQPSSGQPIHLRMHIDATGVITDVLILECQLQDEPFAAEIAAVLRQTIHVPARRDGHNVASTKDVWLQLSPIPESTSQRYVSSP